MQLVLADVPYQASLYVQQTARVVGRVQQVAVPVTLQ